jgi:hypothetical protein
MPDDINLVSKEVCHKLITEVKKNPKKKESYALGADGGNVFGAGCAN